MRVESAFQNSRSNGNGSRPRGELLVEEAPPLEVAALAHAALEVLHLLFVDEDAELPRDRKIQQRREKRGRVKAMIVLRRHHGKHAAEERSAQAVADDVRPALPGPPLA